jgi:hypothetical protein
MRFLLPAFLCMVIWTSCSVQKNNTAAPGASSTASSEDKGEGDTRTKKVAMIDNYTYRLTETTTDETYGYKESNAVKVGGANESSGPLNERRFLNGLSGPNGETVEYYRQGSCCPFKSPNGFMGSGLLDKYKVFYRGSKDTMTIYINMYDKGDLFVPVGFKARS